MTVELSRPRVAGEVAAGCDLLSASGAQAIRVRAVVEQGPRTEVAMHDETFIDGDIRLE